MTIPVRPKELFRRLSSTPGFTVVALATIALGVGANSTIFGVVDSVLLKPLPYPNPKDLISVMLTAPGIKIEEAEMSPSTYFVLREENRTFTDIGVWGLNSVSITGVAEPEQIQAIQVTDGTLPLLGVHPAKGRLFQRRDDSPGAPETAILSYGYWQHKFGGDSSVIGRRLVIDGEAREVIGVLPQSFRFLDRDAGIYLPFRFDRAKLTLGNYSYRGIARLKTGVTLPEATADVRRMLGIVLRSFPAPEGYSVKQFEDARVAPNLRPLQYEVTGDIGKTLWVVMGTIGLVLLIACANVANLLLVRAEGRQQELAVRAALGASWVQLATDILCESIALGVTGGLVGLVFAFGALRALVGIAPSNFPRVNDISIDGTTVLFTFLLSLFAGLLFGSVPVLKYAGLQLGSGLRQSGRTSSASRERHRARNALVVVQVTLALMLLISSGLMIRTARALTKVDPGFRAPEQLQTLRIAITPAQIPNPEQLVRTQQAIVNAIATVPNVTSVALSEFVPMGGDRTFDPVFARDKNYSERDIPIHRFEFVSPGYFKTIGATLAAGRDYDWADLYGRRNVAIVSENLARDYWGSAQAAIGKNIRSNRKEPWREIIGVAPNIYYAGVNQPLPTIAFWNILMGDFEGQKDRVMRTINIVVRSPRTGSESFITEIRRAVWSVNPAVPIANVSTLAANLSRSLARTSFTLVMLSVAAGMALMLGLIGIYGVIAYSVSQRRREIGVRMAIGAQSGDLLGMFVRSGLTLTGLGAILGVVASCAAMHLMGGLLFGVTPVDVSTYASACVALLGAALVASYVPSRKALRVDPSEALRAE